VEAVLALSVLARELIYICRNSCSLRLGLASELGQVKR
jgi:hypothetical protein